RPVEVEEALPVDDQPRTVALEDLVPVAALVDVHLVGETRAAAADDLHAEPTVGDALLGRQRLDLRRGQFGQIDHALGLAHAVFFSGAPAPRFFFQSWIAALMPSSARTEQWILTGGS